MSYPDRPGSRRQSLRSLAHPLVGSVFTARRVATGRGWWRRCCSNASTCHERSTHDYSLSASRLNDIFETRPETILWAFDLLNHRYGGVEHYLRSGGSTDSDLTMVRACLLDD